MANGYSVTVNYTIEHPSIAGKIEQAMVISVPDAQDIGEGFFGAGQAFAMQMQQMTDIVGDFKTQMTGVSAVQLTDEEQADAAAREAGPYIP